MRANRSTLVKLCLLTALAVPVQRATFAASPDQQLLAQADSAVPELVQSQGSVTSATSPDGQISARINNNNEAVIEDASGSTVAGPLASADGAVTTLAFSPDGQTLATGISTGKIRYWDTDGKPKGDVFDTGYGKAITELKFRDNDQIFVAVEGRSGLWDVKDGLYSATPVASADGAADGTVDKADGLPGWLWFIPLLALLGGGALWLLSRRRTAATPEPKRQVAPTATVTPLPTDPDGNRQVSSRAQSVVSTDRVVDSSQEISKSSINASADVPEPTFESTDLETPDLEGTNLDLLTADVVLGGAALGGAALDTGIAEGISADMGADLEIDGDNDEWDENLDLTLDEPAPVSKNPDLLALLPEPQITGTAATPPPLVAPALTSQTVSDDDFWDTAFDSSDAEATADTTDEFISEFIDDADTDADTAADVGPDLSAVLSDVETSFEAGFEAGFEAIEPTRDTIIAETDTVPDIEPDQNTIIGDRTVIFGGTTATTPAEDSPNDAATSDIDSTNTAKHLSVADLASVDEGLLELPDGYGESLIVLLPRDPKWAYAYWDILNDHKEALRNQGGQRLMLRLYDVTDINQDVQAAHSMQQQDCHEMARSWYIEIPVSDRDYTAELGYLTADDRWLMLARSAPVRVPPVYPVSWAKDQFVTISWDERLAGRSFGDLGRPEAKVAEDDSTIDSPPVDSELFALTQQQAQRLTGSLFGSMFSSMQLAPEAEALLPGMASGLNMSGMNMSGAGMASGGMTGGEMTRSRDFWLVASAELIVYGATEPDATVTIDDQVVPLDPDGTFRFHQPFPDGQISYPIRAVAADGEQSRAIQMDFERETPERNTNPQEDAEDEWF